MSSSRIVILGTGNVASILGQALRNNGCEVCQVFGRTREKVAALASRLDATPVCNLDTLAIDADFYIICLADQAIEAVASRMPRVEGTIMHCSGSLDIDVLRKYHRDAAVLYPLQSFTASRNINLATTPFLLEASSPGVLARLQQLASLLSGNCLNVDSPVRLKIHLAAVFACNFANHMSAIASELLEREGLNFDILRPMLSETFDKILTAKPADAQTGPARRNDRIIIDKHIDLLSCDPEWKLVYELLSQSINELNKRNNDV